MCSQLTESQKLPDTCPTGSSQSSQSVAGQCTQSAPWGYLFPNKLNIPWTALSNSEYLVGRAPKCSLVLCSGIDPLIRSQLSKEHFRIRRTPLNAKSDLREVRLEDTSFNGTYVNGKKIGKGRSIVLRSNDIISLALPSFQAFVFMDREVDPEMKHFPLEVLGKYAISRKLGSGAFGEVRLVFDKKTGQGFAMKIIKKNQFLMSEIPATNQPLRVQREINILKKLRHSFVIKFHDVVDRPDIVFLIVELVLGGELFKKIEAHALKESEAKYFFYQLALAIRYLHSNGIIHRDIKPENILLTADTDNPMIKLADFGLSNFVDTESMLKTLCGTPAYTAPEVLKGEGRKGSYDTRADIWSMGIVLYICLSGMSPFPMGDSNQYLKNQILRGYYSFPRKKWLMISRDAQDLVKRMLIVDPKKRITIDKIFEHKWLQDQLLKARVNSLLRQDRPLMGKENFSEDEVEEGNDQRYQHKAKKARVDDDDTSSVSSRTEHNE